MIKSIGCSEIDALNTFGGKVAEIIGKRGGGDVMSRQVSISSFLLEEFPEIQSLGESLGLTLVENARCWATFVINADVKSAKESFESKRLIDAFG